MKSCRSCKHYTDIRWSDECKKYPHLKRSYVNGAVKEPRDINEARASDHLCGEEARGWEPTITTRIIKWLME